MMLTVFLYPLVLVSRIAHSVVDLARKEGIKAGLLVPKTLWPFPSERISELTKQAKLFMSVEMNAGQMVEDVKTRCQWSETCPFLWQNGWRCANTGTGS